MGSPTMKFPGSSRLSARTLGQKRVMLKALEHHQAKRENRKKQSEEAGDLIEFVRYFWHVLEPVTSLVEGWPPKPLCEQPFGRNGRSSAAGSSSGAVQLPALPRRQVTDRAGSFGD
jgi:hypothetical protein